MGEKIFIGNFSKGLTQNRLPFVIDNDAFPMMLNSYSWRGRIKKKRGTSLLGRLAFTNGANPQNNPVMGLRDFIFQNGVYPLLLAFDTTNSYMFNQTTNPGFFYNVSFYKGSGAPAVWSGQDYQQFWTTNYQGALWATNGKPGFQYTGPISNITPTAAPTSTLTVTVPNTFQVGDYVFLYGIIDPSPIPAGQTSLNGVSGIVTAAGNPFTMTVGTLANPVTATYANSTYNSTSIVQSITRTLTAGQDGIRWFDGDPTSGTGNAPTPPASTGWVNFSPPVTQGTFGFDDYLVKQYYLVGATAILAFKDRLLFFGPWIQAADGTQPTQLIDTVLWSWNGTPYYSVPTPAAPSGLLYGYDPSAYLANVTGKGGYLAAGISQPIVTVNLNEDVVLIGFTNRQTRFVYTGNDLDPFAFYSINSEIGSAATFSGITLDRGALTIGSYGLAMTTQVSTQRIDLEIPDLIFNINNLNNGLQRVSAARDFYREWVYFTYPYSSSPWKYPTQSFFYNYRDDTWGVFFENYTSHGIFRISTGGLGLVWSNVGNTYPTWASWDQPWNSSTVTFGFPTVCAGNQQGFVMLLDQGTAEGPSGYVQTVTVLDANTLQINSTNHCLMPGGPEFQVGDYLELQNMTGATVLNGQIGSVRLIPSGNSFDPNNFILSFTLPHGYVSGYVPGSGLFARLCQPFFQTKQFPTYWNDGRQVRLGVQKYLLDNTTSGEITVNIYLSQDPDDPWTSDSIVPMNSPNNSLVYSNILLTGPETDRETVTNDPIEDIGNGVLTAITVNLFTELGFNAPIVPGTVFIQIGSPVIATFSDNGDGTMTATGTGLSSTISYTTGVVVLNFSAAPNLQPSKASLQYYLSNIQSPVAPGSYQIWHRINTSLIGDTVQLSFTLSDAQMRDIVLASSEIALQGIILDVFPGPQLS
jgi:hypothetical protein